MNCSSKYRLVVAIVAAIGTVGCAKPTEQPPPKATGTAAAPPTAATQEPSGTSTFKLPPVTKPKTATAPDTKAETKTAATPASPAGPQTAKPQATAKPPATTVPPVTGKPTATAKPDVTAKPDTTSKPVAPAKPTVTPKPVAGGQSPLLGTWVTAGPAAPRRLEIKENGSGAVMLGDIPWIRFTWVKDGNDIVATHVDNDVKFRITARGEGRLSWRAADGGSAKEVEYERER